MTNVTLILIGQCEETMMLTAGHEPQYATSPGYDDDRMYQGGLNCRWEIQPMPNSSLVFSLMISEVPCFSGDYIKLYKDNETDVINGDSVCGRGRTFGPVTLTGSSLVVVFVSKTSRFSFSTKQGFRLLFLSAADLTDGGCQGRQVLLADDTARYISSPNFPDFYQSNANCEWEIKASTGYDVNILVLFLDIEYDELCTFDNLSFYEGSSSTTNYLCSENNFSFGNIRGRDFVVAFSSDDSENRHGFLIRYKSTASTKKDCTQSTADIVFLLDSSGSVGETNFVFLTSFIADLVYDFNVGPDVVQVGMVTFESNVTNHFNLNQYATKEEVINATRQLPYSGGRTLTDLGLNHTLWHSFTEEHGARSHASRVLLVFTDGASNRPSSTRAVAEEVKQAGITIISVGVESGVDPTELFAIASHEEYVFRATSFTDLETIKYSLESIICKIITSAPSSPALTTTTRSSSLHPPTLQAPILSPSIPVLAPQVSSTDTQSSTVGGSATTTSITSSDVSSSSSSSDVSSSDIAPTGTGSTVEMTSSSPDGVSTSVLGSSSSRVSLTSRTTQQHISSASVSTTTIQSDINSKSNQSSNLPDVKDILDEFVPTRDIIAIISVCTVFIFLSMISCCILLGLCVTRRRQKRREGRKGRDGENGDKNYPVPVVHARANNIHVHYHASMLTDGK
nr:uncharacterized protein LOC105347140 [Crassostrea gigas]